jgi:hypothetical protein
MLGLGLDNHGLTTKNDFRRIYSLWYKVGALTWKHPGVQVSIFLSSAMILFCSAARPPNQQKPETPIVTSIVYGTIWGSLGLTNFSVLPCFFAHFSTPSSFVACLISWGAFWVELEPHYVLPPASFFTCKTYFSLSSSNQWMGLL